MVRSRGARGGPSGKGEELPRASDGESPSNVPSIVGHAPRPATVQKTEVFRATLGVPRSNQ